MLKFLKPKKEIIALFLILVLATFLRFWQLTKFPPGFSADEATIGYNAYSVLKTGRDEYGGFLPLSFKSFSDYQAPLYTYVTIPFIAILGLNELAVRLPSALAGIATIILVYLLLLRLFQDKRLALLGAFFLAISPWHIFFSRGAWQTNLATFCMTAGVYFFVAGLKKGKLLPFSVLAFLASLYAYQSQRLVVPLLGFLVIIFYWQQLVKHKKALIVSAILGFIIFIPIIFILKSTAGQARFKGVSVFTDVGPVNRINQDRGEDLNSNGVIAKVFHNKIQTFSTIIAKNYLEHFGPTFLFISGDPIGRQNIPEFGVIYIFEAVLLPLGLIYAIGNKRFSKSKIILLWLLVAPVASAITFQTPNALRAENMSVPLAIVSAFGACLLIEYLIKKNVYLKYTLLPVSCVVVVYFFTAMLHQYYTHIPKRYGLEWEYGFGKMLSFVAKEQNQYSKIIITDRYDQPYILTLFYLAYDPKRYQTIPKHISEIDKFGFTTTRSFDKFEFKKINWDQDSRLGNTLIIGTGQEIPQNAKFQNQVLRPDGSVAFKIVGT